MEENQEINFGDENLTLRSLKLAPEFGGMHVIQADKAIAPNQHLVLAQGADKLRCLRLIKEADGTLKVKGIRDPHQYAEAARMMGIEATEDYEPSN